MAICPMDSVYGKMISNIMEVQARGARIIAVGPDDTKLADIADRVITVPRTLDFLNPVLCNIPRSSSPIFAPCTGVAPSINRATWPRASPWSEPP